MSRWRPYVVSPASALPLIAPCSGHPHLPFAEPPSRTKKLMSEQAVLEHPSVGVAIHMSSHIPTDKESCK